MSNEEVGTFTPPRAVIPSRAASDAPQARPAFLDEPSPGTKPRMKRNRIVRSKKRRSQRLPAAEIKRINRRRAKNIRKLKKGMAKISKKANLKPGTRLTYYRGGKVVAPKNRRPAADDVILLIVMEVISIMNKLSSSGRARVLRAVAEVYDL
jgi:hypothetical protein